MRILLGTCMVLFAVACSGSNGAKGDPGDQGVSTLVTVTAEPDGANCANGGQRIDTGADTNGNGVLDASEITSTTYVCNGDNGSNGSNGSDGTNTLVTVSAEDPGTNCANGGERIDVGADTNHNGTLDASEITSTSYVCNGGNGSNGANSLVAVTAEQPGPNCFDGGERIDVGLDTDGDGTLESTEITQTSYVCNQLVPAPKLYLASYSGSDITLNAYDITTDTWGFGANMPVAPRSQLTSDGQNVYMLGTDGNLWEYTPSTDSWATNGDGMSFETDTFFKTLDGTFYACEFNTTTLWIRSAGVWSSIDLPTACSTAGAVDPTFHMVFIKTVNVAGYNLLDATTNTVIATVTDASEALDVTSSGATLGGLFYTRDQGGDIFSVDGTGAEIDTGFDPGVDWAAFAEEPRSGAIFVEADGVLDAFYPGTGTVKTLTAGPDENTFGSLVVTY